MASNIVFLISSLLGAIFLFYALIALTKRKDYESERVLIGYKTLLFGVFLLLLSSFIFTLKYLYLVIGADLGIEDALFYVNIIVRMILLPLAAGSFVTGMLLFREL